MFSLAAITFYGGAASYGLFFGITLLPAVSLLHIACVYFRFKIYQEVGSRDMVCGRPERYFFVLKNEDYFAFSSVSIGLFSDFSYVEEIPGDTEYELLPGENFTYETRLVCRYRGEYEVGVKEVVVTDFLKLFRVRYENRGVIKALVRPRLVHLDELKSIADTPAALVRETNAQTQADILVREYVPGDPPGQIHWKAAARTGKLMTRIRTGEEKQGISILCDMTRFSRREEEYLPLENKQLEALLALGYFFAGKDMGFDAYYAQERGVCRQVRGLKDFELFYESVSQVVFDEEGDFRNLLDQVMAQGLLWKSKMVFMVLHLLNDEVMEASQRLAAGGVLSVLYVVADQIPEEYVRQSTERRRIVMIPVEAGLEGRL